MIKSSMLTTVAALLISLSVFSQPLPVYDSVLKVYKAKAAYRMVELQAIGTGDAVPLWMRAGQYGSNPYQGTSFAALAHYVKPYRQDTVRDIDWGVGVQLRADIGSVNDFRVIEAYAKLKLKMFEIRAGRSRMMSGLADSTLSSGSHTISGTALGIPQVSLSLPDYSFPLFDSLFSVKGSLVQGFMGDVPTNYRTKKEILPGYFHQKSAHVRIGKPGWKSRLVVGVVHQAFWVDGKKLIGDVYELTPTQTIWYVMTGKNYLYKPGMSDTTTNVGNHLGTIDFGLEIDGLNTRTLIYHNVLYESENSFKDGALNDGLTGISITNTAPSDGTGFRLQKAVVEYYRTANQAYVSSRPYNYDNYYNHEFIVNGNSYKGTSLGNPFLTPDHDMVKSLPRGEIRNYFHNTRVKLFHVGLEATADKIFLRSRMSFSKNLGLWEKVDRFPPTNSFSMSLEAGRPLKNGWQLRALVALDNGGLLPNSAGGMLSIARSF
jgi:hypothetical protein